MWQALVLEQASLHSSKVAGLISVNLPLNATLSNARSSQHTSEIIMKLLELIQ